MASILRSVMFLVVRELLRRTVRKAGKVSEGVSATRHVTDRLGRHVMIRRKSSFRGDDKRAEDCRGYPGHAPHGAKLLSDRFKGGDEVVSQPHLVQKGVGSETLCQSLSVRVSRMSVKTDIASIGTSIAFRRLLVCVKSRPTQLGMCKIQRICGLRSQTIPILCEKSTASPARAISECQLRKLRIASRIMRESSASRTLINNRIPR